MPVLLMAGYAKTSPRCGSTRRRTNRTDCPALGMTRIQGGQFARAVRRILRPTGAYGLDCALVNSGAEILPSWLASMLS